MTAFPEAMDFAEDRERTLRAVAELARRARETGRLRPEFVVDDLVLILMAHRGLQDTPHGQGRRLPPLRGLRRRGVPRDTGAGGGDSAAAGAPSVHVRDSVHRSVSAEPSGP